MNKNKTQQLDIELLLAVFMHLTFVKDLAQCRFVCEAWESPAIEEIFGRKIAIQSELKAFKLYGHLFSDRTKAQYIKYLQFDLLEPDYPYIYDELLLLAITPNIKTITGSVRANKFFTALLDIIENASPNLDRLTQKPKYTGEDTEFATELLLKTKHLQAEVKIFVHNSMSESKWHFIKQLDQFTNLKEVSLSERFVGFELMEEFFNHFPIFICLRLSKIEFNETNQVIFRTSN